MQILDALPAACRLGVCAFVLMLVSAACWAGPAAEVVFVSGDVRAGTPPRSLSAGDSVQEDEPLVTGADGHVYLRTPDRGFLILRPRSEARIVHYHYDPAQPQATRAKIELTRGVARAVSGEGVEQAREHFRFNTPVAAIGIRGTDFSVFTDAVETRASVRRGAIAMHGLDASCTAEGSGPCAGAVELSALTPEAMLRIRRGEQRPEKLDEPANPLAPDRVAPPLMNELTSQAGGHPTADTGARPGALPRPPEAPRLVDWGRWQALAGLPANLTLSDAMLADRRLAAMLPVFALVRDGAPTMLPREGRASFRLREHEGYFVTTQGQMLESASASNARLTVDFGQRTFQTGMTLTGPSLQTQINASGTFSADGTMSSDFLKSDTNVRGALAGEHGGQAGYLYLKPLNDTVNATGATYWSR